MAIYCGFNNHKLIKLGVLEPIEPISLEGYLGWPDHLPSVLDFQGALQAVEPPVEIGGAWRDALLRGKRIDVGELIAQRAHARPLIHEPTSREIEQGHGRWEWRCGQCGRHQQASDKRLRAAIAAGKRRIVFGVDL